jgi:geranylgeranyl reductase family protein
VVELRDLIVVGAGPAGSHLAQEASEQGLDVLMLERSEEIGRPLACSGHVSPDIWDFVDSRESLLQNSIREARFHVEGSSYRFYQEEPVSYVIDRVGFDKRKAEMAQESGAELLMGEEVVSVDERNGYVEVSVASGETYSSRVLAGCDGASSKVRSEAGLEEPSRFYQGILCFVDVQDSSDNVDVHLNVPEFFGWRIPRGENVEYGVAVPPGESPSEWLEKVLDRHGLERSETFNMCAGGIPVDPPDSVTTDRIFLVGDAAAQTKPFTGGGILYGMRCAEAASRYIDPENPDPAGYEKEWRDELGREIGLGKLIERFYLLPGFLQKPVLRLFSGSIGVHMDRPSSLFSRAQLRAMTSSGIKKIRSRFRS